MHKSIVGVLLASIVTLVFVAGCGGGDGQAAATPTKAQFITVADRICDQDSKTMPEQLLTYQHRAKPNDVAAQGKLFEEFSSEVLLPILETRLDKFRELGVPRGDNGQLEAFMKAMERGVESVKNNSPSTLIEFEQPFEPAIKLGHAYGFKRCAR